MDDLGDGPAQAPHGGEQPAAFMPAAESADPPLPSGFRIARIGRLPDLEGGVYWPNLQPHFRDPKFRMLRYRIVQETGADRLRGQIAAVRGASGIGELEVAYIADRLAATMTVTGAGFPDYCLTSIHRGGLRFSGPAGAHRPVEVGGEMGLVYRGAPGTTLAAAASHERLAVWIPAASLHRRLSALLDGPVAEELAFQPVFAWDAAPAQGLRRLLRLLVDELAAPAPFAGSELARRSFVDLFLYRLLHAIPHNHSARLERAGGAPVPATVRRAEAYIRAHLEEPVAMHDLAGAAGCSVRALQLAFRRFRDTTPLAAIQQARLEAVRDALRAGAAGSTVTDLALRFGFGHPGRFARLYKSAFGQSPAEALRDAAGHRQRGA
jgi:AraC-like DNA-binding protein